MNCGYCYYSELIDGTNFCHYFEEDVSEEFYCSFYVNYERLKSILEEYTEFIMETSGCSDKILEKFIFKNKELFGL